MVAVPRSHCLPAICLALSLLAVGTRAAAAQTAQTFALRVEVVMPDGSRPNGWVSLAEGRVYVSSGSATLTIPRLLTPGAYPVAFSSDPGGVVAVRLVEIAAGQSQASLSMRIGDQVSVRGKINNSYRDADATLQVDKAPLGDLGIHTSLRPGKDGTFLLDGSILQGARIWLWVAVNRTYMPTSEPVVLSGPFPMRITLPPPTRIGVAGHVLDAAGNPAAEAVVIMSPQPQGGPWYEFTDSAGRFMFAGLRPGECYLQVYERSSAYQEIELDLHPGQQTYLAVQLTPAKMRDVRGQVVAADGNTGVPDCTLQFRVHMYPDSHGRPRGGSGSVPSFAYEAVTDGIGVFSLGLPLFNAPLGGTWWDMQIRAPGFLDQQYTGFSPDSAPPEITLQMFRGGTVSGELLLPDGQPVPKGSQVCVGYEVATAPGGSGRGYMTRYFDVAPETGGFEFKIPPGEHVIFGSIPDHADPAAKVTVTEGGVTHITLRSPRGVAIEGTISHAETGMPLPGVRVALNHMRELSRENESSLARTDVHGFFHVGEVGTGPITLYATANGYDELRQELSVPEPGVQELDLKLVPARSIQATESQRK